jgi:hypothetical protein
LAPRTKGQVEHDQKIYMAANVAAIPAIYPIKDVVK